MLSDEKTGEKVAVNFAAPPTEPMQLGPTNLIPEFLAIATNFSCASAPASSASANPDAMTVTTGIPALAQSDTAASTEFDGTIISAKSIGFLISEIEVKAVIPRIVPPFGFTGKISPWYPCFSKYSIGNLPIAPTRSVAPMIATDLADQRFASLFIKERQTLQPLPTLQYPKAELLLLKSSPDNLYQLIAAKLSQFLAHLHGSSRDPLRKLKVSLS